MRSILFSALLLLSLAAVSQPGKPAPHPFCWTFDKSQTSLETAPSRGLADNYFLWDTGQVLSVAFVGKSSEKLREQVLKHARTWEQYANVRLIRAVDSSRSHIRVSLGNEANYTYIGTQAMLIPSGEPTMWIDSIYTDPKQFRATVIHEFGHVLGLMHEHKHPLSDIKWDKEKIFSNIPYCVWDGQNTDRDFWQDFLTQSHSFYTNGTAYDSKSIMHYAIPAAYTLDGKGSSWNFELSEGDKEIISRLYPKGGARLVTDEVFRVDARVKKIQMLEKTGLGYLVKAEADIRPKKEGEIYFAVVLYDTLGYELADDDDDKYNIQGAIAVFEKIYMLQGRALQGPIDMLLPYDQLKLPAGSKKIMAEARIYHYATPLDEFKLLYRSSLMPLTVPTVKIKPVATVPSRAPTQTANRVLGIPGVQQQTQVWCWLAVGEMLFRYYGVPAANQNDYQCGIMGLISAPGSPCYMNCLNCVIPSGGNSQTMRMLREYAWLSSRRVIRFNEARELSFQTIRANIDAGRPVVCGVSPGHKQYYRDSEHVVLLTGYESGPNGTYLIINDPFAYPAQQNPYFQLGAASLGSNRYRISYNNFLNGMFWHWSLSGIAV